MSVDNTADLLVLWACRDHTYAEHPRPLSDAEVAAVRANRLAEVATLGGDPMLAYYAMAWVQPAPLVRRWRLGVGR